MTPDAPKSRNTGDPDALPALRLPEAIPGAISPRTALESYWRQLELTPHERIRPGIMGWTGRASILMDEAMKSAIIRPIVYRQLPNGPQVEIGRVFSGKEVPVVPVGGQGLTDGEREWCARAGQAMARVFSDEARGGHMATDQERERDWREDARRAQDDDREDVLCAGPCGEWWTEQSMEWVAGKPYCGKCYTALDLEGE